MFKSGFISIVGLPNAGKSTFLNQVLGQKVSIISSKPQTTRSLIHGVYTKEDFQIVFLDTPGVQTPKNKLGEFMERSVSRSLVDVDAIIFMVDITIGLREKEQLLLERIKDKAPVILCLNKCDLVDNEKILKTIDELKDYQGIASIVPISAKENSNLEELLTVLQDYLKEGPMYYPGDMITDQTERIIAAEIIREKALNLLFEELPHGIGVNIMGIKNEEERVYIDATIYCEKDSHKGMIIGKKGSMIKQIGQKARYDLQKLFDEHVYLELFVKVVKDWRNKSAALTDLGFTKE